MPRSLLDRWSSRHHQVHAAIRDRLTATERDLRTVIAEGGPAAADAHDRLELLLANGQLAPAEERLMGTTTRAGKVAVSAADLDAEWRRTARAIGVTPERVEVLCRQQRRGARLAQFLASVSGHRLEAVWRLAAMTGMRRGEILGLRWADVDLAAARLSVRHAVVAVAYDVIESTPKSHNARMIDLDPETVELVRAHRQLQLAERDEWGGDYANRDLVAAKENGGPIHPHSFSQSFARLIKRAGLRTIRLHDLRHTHASLALKAGVPVKVVSERLGHESPAFTLKLYAHVMPGMQAAAAAVIAELVREEAQRDLA